METPLKPEVQERYDFMLHAADRLGALARKEINKGITMELKPDGSKVTTADQLLNDRFIQMVERDYPRDLVWGEEGSNSQKGDVEPLTKRWLWLIDPIDGTSGFWRAYNSKDFTDCTSTVMITGFAPGEITPTISVVSAAFHRLKSVASANPAGAFYQTTRAKQPKQLILPQDYGPGVVEGVQRYEQNDWNDAVPNLRVMADMMPYALKMRTSSVGLAMAHLALRHIDVVAFPSPANPHDVAPGALIAKRAGATVQDLHGTYFEELDWRVGPLYGNLGTSNPALAKDFLSKLSLQAA